MNQTVDFLVLGSGLAGLSFALKVADSGKVFVVSKTSLDETNTRYAQGGIAAVTYKPDTFDKHVSDTLVAGAGLCDRSVVEMVVREAPERIQELLRWGTHFDRTAQGGFDLAKEGGHSEHRILHHKDSTGYEIQRALTEKARAHPNITMLEHHFAMDLVTQHHMGVPTMRHQNDIQCYGAYVLDTRTNLILTLLARLTYVATGGVGNVYQTTTNPTIATGDGIAMVYRANGVVENMEFVQFHPTSLYNPGERPSFLITEALRGHGAVLRGQDGKEFMHKYDSRGSLAPRDIVARAIDSELKHTGHDFVLLDATHLEAEDLRAHFPNINQKCLSIGIDFTRVPIPVVPAAHYLCGGIKVNEHGRTSINRLFAGGECTSTGLHGANRLASNSLLEALVFAHRSAVQAKAIFENFDFQTDIPAWNDEGTSNNEEMILITQEFKELQQIMSNYVGIVRSNLRLKRAFDRLEIIYRETEDLYEKSVPTQNIGELRNAVNIAYLVIKMARRRRESRGLHHTVDYPKQNPVIERLH